MTIKELDAYNVDIYMGLKERESGMIHSVEELKDRLQEYCDIVGECVHVMECDYIYKKGREPGVKIGFIQYPRFPKSKEQMVERAKELSEGLMDLFNQLRVTIVTPSKSIMITNTKLLKKIENKK